MDLKAHATYELAAVRRLTEQLLSAFKTPDEWFFQPHPSVNHPLWIAGHLSLVDNLFISRFRPDRTRKPAGWDEVFLPGTKPQSRDVYPAPDEVRQYMQERREQLMTMLNELTDEEWNRPAPAVGERSPIAGAPCMGHMFLFAARHESLHFGQLSVAHRALGYPPLMEFPPKPPAKT